MKEFFLSNRILLLVAKIMVFVVPLFFLSFSPLQLGMDNYGKYFLLGIMTFVLSLLFLFKQLRKKVFSIYYSPLDLPILLMLLAFLLASLFGASKFVSFFGNLSNTNLPFFSLLFLVILYFIFFNLLDSRTKALAIFRSILLSFLFVIPLAFIVVFLYSDSSPSAYLRLALGTAEDLSLYLVYFIVFLLSLFSSKWIREKLFANKKNKLVYNFIIFLAMVLVLRIDFLYAWWMLLLGSVLLILLRLILSKAKFNLAVDNDNLNLKTKKLKKKLITPIVLGVIAINFLLNFYLVLDPNYFNNHLTSYRQLNNSNSLVLLKDTLASNLLLGVGLENFDYAYSKYRSVDVNNNVNWDLRYNKASSFFIYLIVSGGLISAALFLFLAYLVLSYCFKTMALFRKNLETEESSPTSRTEIATVLSPVIVVMLISFFFYSATATSLFLFIVLLAIFMRMIASDSSGLVRLGIYNFDCSNANKRLNIYLASGLFLVFAIVFSAFSIKFLIADVQANYKNTAEDKLLRSVDLSPARYQYHLDLAELFKDKAQDSLKKDDLDKSIEYQRQAINYIHLAQSAAANSVLAQETAAMIYRDFSEGDDGHNQLAINAFKRALRLEPSNPVISAELGQALLKATDYEQAEKYFKKSLELKDKYRPAELGLAKALIGQDQSQAALDILLRLVEDTRDPGVYYELGLLYFNDDDVEKAKTAFSSAVTLSPLYANALFGLALTLEETDEIDKALYYLKKLQRLNPADKQISIKIEELEKK